MIKVFIEKEFTFFNELKYIWEVYCRDQEISFVYSENDDIPDISIGQEITDSIIINSQVYKNLLNGTQDLNTFVSNHAQFYNAAGKADYLTSAFYVLSCAQELFSDEKDQYGRYSFQDSFQYKLNLERTDVVSGYFDKLTASSEILTRASEKKTEKTKVFLSHDIDMLYGSIYQDGFHCLKQKDIRGLVRVFARNLFGQPMWMNMDRIIELEKKYGYDSTFFWLPFKGISPSGIKNADYHILDNKVQKLIRLVEDKGCINGLHKACDPGTFEDEIKRIGVPVLSNRFHFLAGEPHKDLIRIENAGIKFDSSISFADKPGFRNGYSKPYLPYIFSERRAAKLVECPMHIMDTTYYNYMKISADEAYQDILSFLGDFRTNSTITLLWHNNFISDYKYKHFCTLYERVLKYLQDDGFECCTPNELIKKYNL